MTVKSFTVQAPVNSVAIFRGLKLVWQPKWRHDIQDNNIQDNDTQHKGLIVIFFITYEWAQLPRVSHYIGLERLVWYKRSSFLGPFVS
jgi:hypothetical protein